MYVYFIVYLLLTAIDTGFPLMVMTQFLPQIIYIKNRQLKKLINGSEEYGKNHEG